jgi:signal transduction histidine kinase
LLAQHKEETAVIDSLLKSAVDKDNVQEQRALFFQKAYELTEELKVDSLKMKYFSRISLRSIDFEDTSFFRKANKMAIRYAQKLNDSSIIAFSYWDSGVFHENNKTTDSAYLSYSDAHKIFEEIKSPMNSANMLLNMSIIQRDVKDYIGSEATITPAIKIFTELNAYERLYRCYNNLGIAHNNLEEYDQAIEYYNYALDYLKKISKTNVKESSTLNNIGVVYSDQNKHEKAIEYYNKALQYDSLFYEKPKLYATLTDNLAYSKFKLDDTQDLPQLFYKALQIRDSLNIQEGIIINKLHLSEYFLSKNDTITSKKYSIEAMNLAKKTNAFRDLLASYKLLAEVDVDNKSKYLEQYININDSLVKYERSIRNKFAQIRYETDIVRNKNEKLSIQNTWIVAISTAIIFFGFLIYIITQQRTRNKELEMEQQQQRANEEIYNLMIDQQDKIEEGRKREKERISLELHDGILGRLFGTRLSLGSLNAKDDNDSKKVRQQYINELQSIEEEVRNISHELGLDNFDKSTSYSTMIANLLEEQSKITNFKYQIEDDDRIIWTDIPGHIKINIYRIIQESIQNINKYAQAENVILDFKKNDNRIILTIKDDGVGFDQDKRSSGIGLKNMKSRVTLLHGQFTINSIPGKGTSISVDVPMT